MRTRTLALVAAAALAATAVVAADLPAANQSAKSLDTVQKADLLAARQDWDGAIAVYLEAIDATPKDPVLRNRLGMCYQRKGDEKNARAAYRKAIDLKKDYAEAWNNLGTIEHERGKYKKATSAYAKAIKLNPQKPVFYKNLGTAWLARNDVEKALEAWNEAFRLDPTVFGRDSVKVPGSGASLAQQYYLYAKLLASHGEVERALAYLEKARSEGWSDFRKVERDGDFASLVADPRYAALK
jgi:Flp pilus assembly protein TadD